MAEYIRNTHQLPTIRVRFQPERSGARLIFDTYYGNDKLAHEEMSAELAGIMPKLSIQDYRGASFQIAPEILDTLAGSLEGVVEPDEPRWLQVGPSSGHLAVVPWERLLQERVNSPLLRIPNFLADPVFLNGPLRLALCVSSPQAKSPFIASEYAAIVADVVANAAPGSEIHVFTDMDGYHSLQSSLGGKVGIQVHDPQEAERYEIGDVDRNLRGGSGIIRSPWLRWMQDTLLSQPVDAVHFVCPGYFRRDQGALALARSPTLNTDRNWSHFVGIDELIAFLNRVGAWTTVFSPPFDNVWSIGLRLLADRLAWQRPGPTILHDTEHGSFDTLFEAYRFLFSEDAHPPPASPWLMLYSHPKRLERFATGQSSFESVSTLGLAEEFRQELPDALDDFVAKTGREERTLANMTIEEPWQQSTRRVMDQVLLGTEGRSDAARKGILEALATVNGLLEGTEIDINLLDERDI